MNLVLKKPESNSAMEQTATQDLFDAAGVLLLKKGQPLTAGIRELLEKREVLSTVHTVLRIGAGCIGSLNMPHDR
ncbi:hypothetical protein [Paradesulfitobacterium ferrireducens]|uniref:hypothetical protein n=1 Tax=Paradesulfitobacterium ferrireducens TaxID=2816476 RepID=UPI001A90C441|nr:hypothetical protein [Paradesulfitobacterium ferrireducens]